MAALPVLPGQVVLVFQGGGALGAYQGGVYQALHEAEIEPNWVIGTSIGAINGAIIAGNDFEQRLDRLREFWDRLERKSLWSPASLALIGGNFAAQMMTIFSGISGYFAPNRALAWGMHAPVGVERGNRLEDPVRAADPQRMVPPGHFLEQRVHRRETGRVVGGAQQSGEAAQQP